MNNIFFLVLDAFCYDSLNRKVGNEYVAPFLRSLSTKSLFAKNAFAQAPYTEASLVSILSGSDTLGNGGYLFGNKNINNTVFQRFKDQGYCILSQYSPYVYSKAYLKDVDEFYYTRLLSCDILFCYRLSYFKEKKNNGTFSKTDYHICKILLEEEFETWIVQAERILSNDKSCDLIKERIDKEVAEECLQELMEEQRLFLNDSSKYIDVLFTNFSENSLVQINKKYNEKVFINDLSSLQDEFGSKLEHIQNKYNQALKHNKIDPLYIFRTIIKNLNGKRDAVELYRAYKSLKTNEWIKNYFKDISNGKVESCMSKQFSYTVNRVEKLNSQGKKVLTYLHVQDFHLPSVMHSLDEPYEKQEKELIEICEFAEKVDKNYKGNLLADLSARYCDNRVKDFFNLLKEKFGDDFSLIITADHGFPAYFTPPRPFIYNQTYVEAFHIPFILYDGKTVGTFKNFISIKDFFNIVYNPSSINKNSRPFILTEHAGPGCPMIGEKPIWYTFIDNHYRISFECLLRKDLDSLKIVDAYDLQRDPFETNNLVKYFRKHPKKVSYVVDCVAKRHKQIRENFDFYGYGID